jgi:type I restriction enzyme S subunit
MREDWVEVEIGNVADLYQPKTIASKLLKTDGEFPVYGANGIIGNYDKFNHHEKEFLITCRGATCGNVHITEPFSWINGNAMVVRPFDKELLGLKYLYFAFSNKGRVQKAISGSAQPQITRTTLFPIKVPLAPLPIQRAIVFKIESLFSALDKGIEDLNLAKTQLKVYRQAVLKKAFEGELTNSQNKITLVQFGEEVKIVSGNTPKGINDAENRGTVPFYKVSDMNISGNEIVMKHSNLWIEETIVKKLKLKIYPKGTVIFPKRGGAILTNKKRILGQEATFDLNLMGVVPNDNFLSEFLYFFFISQDLGKICDGSAVPQINNKNIAPLEFPKCNIDIQKEIVREIESRLSVCDQVERSINESLEKAKALRQSILKKAFDGKLLTKAEIEQCKKEEDYEAAGVLLEKIRKEKKK